MTAELTLQPPPYSPNIQAASLDRLELDLWQLFRATKLDALEIIGALVVDQFLRSEQADAIIDAAITRQVKKMTE